MALIKPCPRCQNPLEIPQPPPEQIRCDKCGAVINKKVRPAEKQEAPAASPPSVPVPAGEPAVHAQTVATPSAVPLSATSRRGLFILGILGGLLLIGGLPVAGLTLAWYLSSEKAPEEKRDLFQGQVKDQEKEKPEGPKEMPMSPKIRAAIDKGAAYLKKQMLAGTVTAPAAEPYGGAAGVETGKLALAGLALLEAGVSPREPAVQMTLDHIRKNGRRVALSYSLGTVLFFLNRMDQANALTEDDHRLQVALTLQLVGGQCQDGRWTYLNLPLSPVQEQELLKTLEAKTYRPTKTPTTSYNTSNSMTQFALLALWGGRQRVSVRQPILHAAARFHATQSSRGTWGYAMAGQRNSYEDSNTCAGLLALAMEKALREDKKFRESSGNTDPPANLGVDEQCSKAFAHLSKVIGRTKDTPLSPLTVPKDHGSIFRADAASDYYFLWCLERVAVIYDLKEIGGKDWYGWGSEVLLQTQKADGSWFEGFGDVPDTCFAILFLSRANLAKDLTEIIRTRGGKAALP